MLWQKTVGAGDTVPPSAVYNAFQSAATGSSSTFTISGVSFGSASLDRVVIVCLYGGASSSVQINSVTIGGVSATLAARSTADPRFSGIFSARVPTGTTGDVSVTLSGIPNPTVFIHSFSAYDLFDFSAVDAQISQSVEVNVSPSRSVTLNVARKNSVVVGCWSAGAVASGGASTWTNLTERADNYASPEAFTAAMDAGITFGSLQVTCTNSDNSVNRPVLIAAVWR